MNNYNEVLNNYKLWYEDIQDEVEFEKKRKLFIQQQLQIGLSRVQIEPTQRCNYSCHMCPIDELNINNVKKDLSFDDFCLIVNQLPKGVKTICLSGLGEPFLNKDYIQMTKYAKEQGFITEVYNNGSLFDEKILDYTDYIFFSVDGLTKELLEELRGGVKYDKLFSSIKKSVEYKSKINLKICINFTISDQNYKEIPLLFKACNELGIDYLHIQAMANNYSVNGEKAISFSKYIDEHKFEDWKFIIEEYNSDFKFNLTIWYPKPSKGFCHWTFSSLYINKNLDVISCCQRVTEPHIFGNLKTASLNEIYNSKGMYDFREKHKLNKNIPLCNNCPN